MTQTLHVHYLPDLAPPEAFAGSTVVVIDVLRATTTIVHALAAGAREVRPFCSVDEVEAHAASSSGTFVRGGERGGVKIDGFDLGNSPAEYGPDAVGGKSLLFTTTNGTRAMAWCGGAGRVLLAAAVNLSAVVEVLRSAERVSLVCAGTAGTVTREDVLIAGAMVYKLCRGRDVPPQIDDCAHVAQAAWRGVVAAAVGRGVPLPEHLAEEFRETAGGRNLIRVGHEADLVAAAAIDSLAVVPEFDFQNGRIVLR